MTDKEKEKTNTNITDPAGIKRITSKFYKQFYMHKFDCLDEMNQFLKKYKLYNSPNIK